MAFLASGRLIVMIWMPSVTSTVIRSDMGQLLFGSAGIEFQFYIRLGYNPESYDHWFAGAGAPGRGVRQARAGPGGA